MVREVATCCLSVHGVPLMKLCFWGDPLKAGQTTARSGGGVMGKVYGT